MTSDSEALQLALYARIATELALKSEQVQRTVALLLDDATVPFIARYRKEATGNLDEEQIRHIAERHKYYQELEQRRTTIVTSLTEQGKLTEALRVQILACFNKVELEDLYLPYRPKRQTKATVAMERGLEPLAHLLWEQQPGEQSIPALATPYARSRFLPDGRKYSARMRTPVAVPVLQLQGAQDTAVSPTATTPPHLVTARLRHELITTAGHFPHEETPDLFNALLLDWLPQASRTKRRNSRTTTISRNPWRPCPRTGS